MPCTVYEARRRKMTPWPKERVNVPKGDGIPVSGIQLEGRCG